MGTHMWSNGASRRGRRMSLDLPPIPMTPKDSEFLQRRPDLFYPYLPAPFLNGMQQKVRNINKIKRKELVGECACVIFLAERNFDGAEQPKRNGRSRQVQWPPRFRLSAARGYPISGEFSRTTRETAQPRARHHPRSMGPALRQEDDSRRPQRRPSASHQGRPSRLRRPEWLPCSYFQLVVDRQVLRDWDGSRRGVEYQIRKRGRSTESLCLC